MADIVFPIVALTVNPRATS